MNFKTIIFVAISVAFLAASAYMLRNTFFGASAVVPDAAPTNQMTSAEAIFPYGDKLNLDIAHTYNHLGVGFNYPKVDPATDLGVSSQDFIKSDTGALLPQ